MIRNSWWTLLLALMLAGCYDRADALRRLRTGEPRVQTEAIAQVVRAEDKALVGELIELLGSTDEGVRFMAAAGLRRLTGIDRGFQTAPPEQRGAIIEQWRQWWHAQPGRADAPPPAEPPPAADSAAPAAVDSAAPAVGSAP
jgi:hypothetical protein